MNEEHLRGYSSLSVLPQPPKRKRTPSQYAAQIADFKNNHTSITKKQKTLRFFDNEEGAEENVKEVGSKAILCILPSGKKYSLKIVSGKIKNRKIEKAQKNKQTKRQIQRQVVKEQKKKEVNTSLFDKFLLVCQELQKKSDNESKEAHQNSKENEEKILVRREDKAKKEKQRDERWSKFYDRFRILTERMEKLQANYIFLD